MKFERHYYAHRLNEPFGMFGTVLTIESNVEMGVVDLDSEGHSMPELENLEPGQVLKLCFVPSRTQKNDVTM